MDRGTVEHLATTEWSASSDSETKQLFVELLNQTLRSQLRDSVRYWSNEECFALVGESKKLSYQSLKRRSAITAISKFSTTNKEGRTFEWLRHLAFRGMFRPFEGEWCLEITPTYRFTRDGQVLDRFHEERLKGIKRIEGNRAVLSCVLFWADYLQPKADLFATVSPPIRFGSLLTFEAPVGVNDKHWLSGDPEFDRAAETEKDSMDLPDVEDLFA